MHSLTIQLFLINFNLLINLFLFVGIFYSQNNVLDLLFYQYTIRYDYSYPCDYFNLDSTPFSHI